MQKKDRNNSLLSFVTAHKPSTFLRPSAGLDFTKKFKSQFTMRWNLSCITDGFKSCDHFQPIGMLKYYLIIADNSSAWLGGFKKKKIGPGGVILLRYWVFLPCESFRLTAAKLKLKPSPTIIRLYLGLVQDSFFSSEQIIWKITGNWWEQIYYLGKFEIN